MNGRDPYIHGQRCIRTCCKLNIHIRKVSVHMAVLNVVMYIWTDTKNPYVHTYSSVTYPYLTGFLRENRNFELREAKT